MPRKERGNFLTPLCVDSSNTSSVGSTHPTYRLTPYDRKCLKRLKKKGCLDMIPPFYNPIGKLRNGKNRRDAQLKRWKAFLLEN